MVYILPWRSMDGSVIRMYCDIKYPDGTPFERDVRYILKKAVNKAKEMGISVNFGSEFEFLFYLSRMKMEKIPMFHWIVWGIWIFRH